MREKRLPGLMIIDSVQLCNSDWQIQAKLNIRSEKALYYGAENAKNRHVNAI